VAVFALGSPELGLWWRQGSNCLDCHYQFFPPELNYLWWAGYPERPISLCANYSLADVCTPIGPQECVQWGFCLVIPVSALLDTKRRRFCLRQDGVFFHLYCLTNPSQGPFIYAPVNMPNKKTRILQKYCKNTKGFIFNTERKSTNLQICIRYCSF
jgi:hypothetical protein